MITQIICEHVRDRNLLPFRITEITLPQERNYDTFAEYFSSFFMPPGLHANRALHDFLDCEDYRLNDSDVFVVHLLEDLENLDCTNRRIYDDLLSYVSGFHDKYDMVWFSDGKIPAYFDSSRYTIVNLESYISFSDFIMDMVRIFRFPTWPDYGLDDFNDSLMWGIHVDKYADRVNVLFLGKPHMDQRHNEAISDILRTRIAYLRDARSLVVYRHRGDLPEDTEKLLEVPEPRKFDSWSSQN